MLHKELVLLSIILILAGLTHLWNVVGFPLYTDEGHYLRRSLVVSKGIGLQEKTGFYRDAYDHPFFGQLLIGTILRLSGYPNFVMSQTISSIGLAIAFPRIIIGIFAIIDTFLVFKIAQRVYNTKVASFASLLFSVSPMTWQLRLITLDNIAMPFLLTSILVSLSIQTWNKKWKFHRHISLVLLSGTLLGLAMLTKVPLFTMIPLVGYLVYKNSNHLKSRSPLKMVFVWLIPIILIPSIWPLYAISVGEFDLWKHGALHQVEREDRRSQIMESFFNTDSMLLFLGLAGLIYSFLRKNWIVVLWIVPFLIFVYVHGWFNFFHWVIVLPAFCIAGAKLVFELIHKMKFDRTKKSLTLIMVCAIIAGVGLFNTFIIINRNIEGVAIRGIAESLDYMDRADGLDDDRIDEKITVITNTAHSWIYKYIYNLNYTFDTHRDIGTQKIETKKTIIYQDEAIADRFNQLEKKFSSFVIDMGAVKRICNLDIEWQKADFRTHTPLMVILSKNDNSSNNIKFTTKGSDSTKNPQRLDLKNTSARYINMTIFQNMDKRNDVITKISMYGKDKKYNDCKIMPYKKILFSDDTLLFDRLNSYDIIASYQILLNDDLRTISKYRTQALDLNDFTKLFSPNKYPSWDLELLANY